MSRLTALPVLCVCAALPLASAPASLGCASGPSAAPELRPAVQQSLLPALAEETRLKELIQLTREGENAEAYFSFDGRQVSLQRRTADIACDRIYTLQLFDERGGPLAGTVPQQISSGQGATTCSHFFPDGRELLYASTHLAGAECPPKPDMSQGYVWALYDSYDVFKANADGSQVTRLTDAKGYDAEGTVCGRDGSIVFTSVRDGDIELYRMDKDGKNVKRLTFEPGYDGGAFFNADCSKIVWRASRPKPGPELDNFKELLGKGLVRPTKLELFVANADGSEPRQVTYLSSASFAPFWYPNRERIIFSSNYGDPKGREFELWAINADGTELERITYAPGFDGFPMFTPDGKWLIFASNRATAPGASDTNLFLTQFDSQRPSAQLRPETSAAERIARDAAWLADPAREGRGVGTAGLAASGEYIEGRLRELGLAPLGDAGSYRMPFEVTTEIKRAPATQLKLAESAVADEQFVPVGYSAEAKLSGEAVLAGYALADAELGIDDFKGKDVKNKIVVARRFAPEQRRAGDLRKKAFQARARGAKGLIVVDWPGTAAVGGGVPGQQPVADNAHAHAAQAPGGGAQLPAEASLPELRPEGTGDAGIPVIIVKRAALEAVWARLESGKSVPVSLQVAFTRTRTPAFNVLGRIRAGADGAQTPTKEQDAPLIVGAHYDHLGYGGQNSLAPDQHVPHLGADDNASGVATLLEIARELSARRKDLKRDVIIAAFSAEESGVLGSAALVNSKPSWLGSARGMLNLDMVGRLRNNSLTVLGSQTATEWPAVIDRACTSARVHCNSSGDGYGPSDQISFYTAGLPVLHLFTGAHSDYHKPSDTAAQLNATGMAQVAQVALGLIVGTQDTALHYQKVAAPPGPGDARSWNASLGTIPDYAGPPQGLHGVLLADVRPGGGAALAGMRRGDVIVRLGKFAVGSVEDLMFVLMQAKPGESVTAVVVRDQKQLSLPVTFQEGRRH